MQKTNLRALAAGFFLFGIGSIHADAYLQNFDTGSATFTANDPFWTDTSSNGCNGYVVMTTDSMSVCSGRFDRAGQQITSDVSGTGYFLFDGTSNYPGGAGGNIPAGSDEFFISPSFTVAPNTTYDVSFYLTNADSTNPASIQPEIGGMLLGSSVSAVGDFDSNGWQQFTFAWNSGANTSAQLILNDYTQFTGGNDFGIDVIDVNAVPEPGYIPLLGAVFATAALYRRRRIS